MKADWRPLRQELALWRQEGRVLPIWWRDDDAIEVTKPLESLISLADLVGVPVHLAVIPRDATQKLADRIVPTRAVIPVVHGWGHESHTLPPLKKAEFGATRNRDAAAVDIRNGLARLHTLFGDRLAKMFVPPWNRIDPELMPVLAKAGYSAVSTYLPRKSAMAAPGLMQINTHIDPIYWRGTRGLVDPDTLIAQIVQLLSDRRNDVNGNEEPLGYLTHHLVHDADIWAFSKQFLQEICEGPVTLYRHDEKDQA